ncbi:RcpC/CpaB family pilus assembly protein [Streptomyces sp. NPDC003691]
MRIADAETVRLLRPGDRVDVIATPGPPPGAGAGPGLRAGDGSGRNGGSEEDGSEDGAARVVVAGVRVTAVPEPPGVEERPEDGGGALVVLSVPRASAAELAGAAATSRLAVTVC